MSKKVWSHSVLVLSLVLVGAQAASAKYLYSYSVKFVCGYNDSNIGYTSTADGAEIRQGEPSVKFGNYATEINIFNFNVNTEQMTDAIIQKNALVLVEKGRPVGREPRIVSLKNSVNDNITLKTQEATMDDCNRIGELLWGAGNIPNPFPLTIGFFVIQSTVELDVTAVYTSQVCSHWVVSPEKMACLDAEGKYQGVSSAIDVRQVTGHRLYP